MTKLLRTSNVYKYVKTINALRSALRRKGNSSTRFGYYTPYSMLLSMKKYPDITKALFAAQHVLIPSLYANKVTYVTNNTAWVQNTKPSLGR